MDPHELTTAIRDSRSSRHLVRLLNNHNIADFEVVSCPADTTPLGYAAMAGNIEKCLLLLNYGVGVDVKDGDGFTPLMLAAIHDHCEIVALLLVRFLAFVNETNATGHTALYHACSYPSHNTTTQLLMQFGADPTMKSLLGVTPLEVAKQNQQSLSPPDKAFQDVYPYFEKYITTRTQHKETMQKCQAILDRAKTSNHSRSVWYYEKILGILQAIEATKICKYLFYLQTLGSDWGDESARKGTLTVQGPTKRDLSRHTSDGPPKKLKTGHD